jgi:hypothetical protein
MTDNPLAISVEKDVSLDNPRKFEISIYSVVSERVGLTLNVEAYKLRWSCSEALGSWELIKRRAMLFGILFS